MRNAVGADDLQPAGLTAEQVEGRAQGPYEQVLLVAGQRVRALAGDVDVQPGVGDPDDHVVVQAQRQAEGVETRAQVGAGCGDAHPDGGGSEGGTGHRSDDSPCEAAGNSRSCGVFRDRSRLFGFCSVRLFGFCWGSGIFGVCGSVGILRGECGGGCGLTPEINRRPQRPEHPGLCGGGGLGTAYRRKVLSRHRAHRRRTMRVAHPRCARRPEKGRLRRLSDEPLRPAAGRTVATAAPGIRRPDRGCGRAAAGGVTRGPASRRRRPRRPGR